MIWEERTAEPTKCAGNLHTVSWKWACWARMADYDVGRRRREDTERTA
jgi:hypothetical protein